MGREAGKTGKNGMRCVPKLTSAWCSVRLTLGSRRNVFLESAGPCSVSGQSIQGEEGKRTELISTFIPGMQPPAFPGGTHMSGTQRSPTPKSQQ